MSTELVVSQKVHCGACKRVHDPPIPDLCFYCKAALKKPPAPTPIEDNECIICYEPVSLPTFARPCGHRYDLHCIRRWLNQEQTRKCPYCRQQITHLNKEALPKLAIAPGTERYERLRLGTLGMNPDEFTVVDSLVVLIQSALKRSFRKSPNHVQCETCGENLMWPHFDSLGAQKPPCCPGCHTTCKMHDLKSETGFPCLRCNLQVDWE